MLIYSYIIGRDWTFIRNNQCENWSDCLQKTLDRIERVYCAEPFSETARIKINAMIQRLRGMNDTASITRETGSDKFSWFDLLTENDNASKVIDHKNYYSLGWAVAWVVCEVSKEPINATELNNAIKKLRAIAEGYGFSNETIPTEAKLKRSVRGANEATRKRYAELLEKRICKMVEALGSRINMPSANVAPSDTTNKLLVELERGGDIPKIRIKLFIKGKLAPKKKAVLSGVKMIKLFFAYLSAYTKDLENKNKPGFQYSRPDIKIVGENKSALKKLLKRLGFSDILPDIRTEGVCLLSDKMLNSGYQINFSPAVSTFFNLP